MCDDLENTLCKIFYYDFEIYRIVDVIFKNVYYVIEIIYFANSKKNLLFNRVVIRLIVEITITTKTLKIIVDTFEIENKNKNFRLVDIFVEKTLCNKTLFSDYFDLNNNCIYL